MNREILEPHRELRFGRFRLQPAQRQLFENNVPVKLGGRAFDVLWALVERRERAVPKDELMQLAWPKRVVEENNLQVQVVTLRKLLGAASNHHHSGTRLPVHGTARRLGSRGPHHAAVEAESPTAAPPTNLPAVLQPLDGRDDDLARLSKLIERHPLVSVVGRRDRQDPLAQAAAYGARADFADGVWVVELAPLAAPRLAISTVAQTLELQLGGEPNVVDLAATLRTRRMLLVLDNCEHLVDSMAEIVSALRREAALSVSLSPVKSHCAARRAGISARHLGPAGERLG